MQNAIQVELLDPISNIITLSWTILELKSNTGNVGARYYTSQNLISSEKVQTDVSFPHNN